MRGIFSQMTLYYPNRRTENPTAGEYSKMKNWMKFALVTVLALSALMPTLIHAEYTADQKKQIDELKKTYPLTTCVVSKEKLEHTDMGDPVDYLYTPKKDGKETARLVRFCCPGCIKKFNKDPEKYLKDIDDSTSKK